MIYGFLLILVLYCILCYLLCNKEILSPGFFCALMYLLGVIVLFFKKDEWRVDIRVDTVFLIFLFLLFILIGDLVASVFEQSKVRTYRRLSKIYLALPNWLLVLLSGMMILTLVFYFRDTITIASRAGWTGDYRSLLQYARMAKNIYETYVSTIAQYMSYVCEAINYFCLFIFCNNTCNCKARVKNEIKYLIPILGYVGIAVLTTGRTLLLRIVFFVLVVLLLQLYKNNNWRNVRIGRILKLIIFFILIASIVFFLAGKLTGKSVDREFFDYVAVYFSSSIAAFNEYMKEPFHNTDSIWGGHTLYGFYTILRRFVKTIPILSSPLEMLTLPGGQTTNIYTPIRRYFQDFGYTGVIIIAWGIGFFYKKYYNRIKIVSDPFKILLFAYLFFPLIEIGIEERIFLDLFTLKTAFVVCGIWFLYRICCQKCYLEDNTNDSGRNCFI